MFLLLSATVHLPRMTSEGILKGCIFAVCEIAEVSVQSGGRLGTWEFLKDLWQASAWGFCMCMAVCHHSSETLLPTCVEPLSQSEVTS